MASSSSPQPTPGTARVLAWLLGAVVAAYVVWTLPGVRPDTGFDVRFDGLLQGGAYVLVALAAVAGARHRAGASLAWWTVAGAVALRAVGFVLALSFVSVGRPLAHPSIADAAWILAGLALLAGVALRLHELAPRLSRLAVLDGVAASLLSLGLVAGALAGPIESLTAPGTPRGTIEVNIGYPVLDAALLVAASALVTAPTGRRRRADLLLVAGIVVLVLVDVSYFIVLAGGSWRPGTLLATFSMLSTVLVTLAVWSAPTVGATRRRRRLGEFPETTAAPTLVLPIVIALLAVLGLITSGAVGGSDPSMLFYGAAVTVAMARGALTLRSDRRAAGLVIDATTLDVRRFQALVEASNDFIGMADAEGHVLYVNPGGRHLLGIPPDRDVATLSVADLVPGHGPTAFATRWPLLLERGSWEGEAEVVPLDGGKPIPIAISTFVVYDPETGQPMALATIQRDMRELKRQENAFRDIADQRARLLTRLVQAQEDERAQIAANVHDDSLQTLAVVDLRLSMLRRRLSGLDAGALETLDEVQQSVSAAADRLRHLLFDLEPPARDGGLGESLDRGADYVFADSDTTWQVTGQRDLVLSEAERVTVYRVAMEAMVNARKHADARRVVVELAQDTDAVTVTVRDDGCGLVLDGTHERPGHKGLASMRDRAEIAGGRLEIRALPDRGTEVRLSLPTLSPGPPG